MTDVYNMMSRVGNLTLNCYYGILYTSTINWATLFTSDELINNILYNLGYMFTDVLNIIIYNPKQTNRYSYYLGFNVGDFFIRFLYYNTNAP